MKQIVINECFGGFGLSDEAYEWLISKGIPVRKYIKDKRDPIIHKYIDETENKGKIIFDSNLSEDDPFSSISGMRYWDTWIDKDRENPLLIEVVKKLGEKADGRFADLKIVNIPDEVEYTIEEYDGLEHVAEKHRTWR